jgi:transposase
VDLLRWENLLVAIRFRPVVRDQEFLLPPNMTDWLPAGHVVWFLIDVVERMDLTALLEQAALRRDGQRARNTAGRAAYDPQMLLTLLIYGYACGERSSRQIERLCHTDIAFRLICAGDIPDHTVIARFRKTHTAAFAELFTEVLLLCKAAALVTLCTVAIDGSKIAGNASRQANRSEEWLATQNQTMQDQKAQAGNANAAAHAHDAPDPGFEELVGQILAAADDTDAAEDVAFGPDARGDELPPGWDHRHADRHARIEAGLARIAQVKKIKQAEQAAKAAEQARRDADALAEAEQALATEISTRLAAQHAWEQQWEHASTNRGAPLPRGRAPKPVDESGIVMRARTRVDKARHRVEHPDTAPRRGGSAPDPDRRGRRDRDPEPRANLTDPDSTIMPTKDGWIQGYNTQFSITADQIILATEVSTNPADIVSYDTMVTATEHAADMLGVSDAVGALLFDTGYTSNATLTAPEPNRLMALGKSHSVQTRAREHPTDGPPPPEATPREAMDHRLRTPEGAKLYKRRGATVEPGIGNFKKIIDRYCMRGLDAVTSETHLGAAVHNLLKIHRAAPT